MTTHFEGSKELSRQASIARTLGSPFVAEVLEAGERQLASAPRTATLIQSWPGDRAAAALGMRFNAAIHALARRGRHHKLSTLYQRQHHDFDGALAAAMEAEDEFIATWMRHPPQTNEVCRAGAIMAALAVAQELFGMPFELLELGSSAGLNLNLAHYGYELGGIPVGTPGSSVRIAPEWHGPPPPGADIRVLSARGVDLSPLDTADEATRERLLSFVFADQPSRAERLRNALLIAQRLPPRVDRANALTWLKARLDEPQAPGRCRAIFHSMFLQYLCADERLAIDQMLDRAGSQAGSDRPLVRIGFEWTEQRTEVQLRLTIWPSGKTFHLATCHPYGASIDWHDASPPSGGTLAQAQFLQATSMTSKSSPIDVNAKSSETLSN